MADFRKLFIVLAVLAVVATSAFGQPFTCNASAVNEALRLGGITELTGNINLTCPPNTTPVGPVTTAFSVLISGSSSVITNSLGTKDTNGVPFNNVFLAITDNSGAAIGLSPYQGYQSVTNPALAVFPNVSLPTGSTGQINITISGIRVLTGVIATNSSQPVYATVTTNPAFAVSASNSLLQVGSVTPALAVSVPKGGNGTGFQQCISNPLGEVENFDVQFSSALFKNKSMEGPDASQGTRLLATFTNVPAGVTIYVNDGSTGASTGAAALLVPNADATGSGGSVISAATGFVKANQGATGVWYATWEVTSATGGNANLVFGVQAVFKSNTTNGIPGLTSTTSPATFAGNFAPVSTDLAPETIANAPIPRFQSLGLPPISPIFTIAPCITNLLFPYVTNTQGYDTGLAIVNTSMDVFGTATQTGACTLNFFGSSAPATAFTTPTINPGTVYAAVLEGVGAPGFEGYIIAQCNFQYGHGLAFIVNPGGVGTQYLALVIPNLTSGTRPPNPFDQSTVGAGDGEQLGE